MQIYKYKYILCFRYLISQLSYFSKKKKKTEKYLKIFNFSSINLNFFLQNTH